MSFLGILVNTVEMTLRILPEGMVEIQDETLSWLNRKSTTLHELQCLIGKLSFVATTIPAERIFFSRLLNLLRKMPQRGRKTLSAEAKKDIKWWHLCLEQYDGVSFMLEPKWKAPDTVFSTDACLDACGGWADGEFFHTDFPENIRRLLMWALMN